MALQEYAPALRSETKNSDAIRSPEMQRRAAAVLSFRDSYRSLMNRTGFGSLDTTRETLQWLADMKLTDDVSEKKSIHWREDFIRKDGSLVLEKGESLYQTFTSHMSAAAPYISKASYNRWFDRLYDTSAQSSSMSSFQMKMAWVQSELGNFVGRWKKVAEDRDTVVKNPLFKDIIAAEPELAILSDREKCLDLHFRERRGLVSKAIARINAQESSRLELYATAKEKLQDAATNKWMLDGKVGVWLERIFASKADPKKIVAFVNGSGAKSLEGLIQNWAAVKERYDAARKKFAERGNDASARGFTMKSPVEFLSMHYTKRLSYVKQAEERLKDAINVESELPIFLKIRHAMDMKDWSEASALIAKTKTMHIRQSDWPRLKSMENHVAKFSEKIRGGPEKVNEKQKRLRELLAHMEHSHSEMIPLVKRLLRSPSPNRGIHQLRWITYNNLWCRTHGGPYLDEDIARKGASEDQTQLTKHRAENGLDVGRHDSLDYATADSAYFRKQELSRHKATFLHTNMGAGGVVSALGEKLEHEQDPRWLYWTTLCPHLNGEPKSEEWMREFLYMLTEMRSLTRPSDDEPNNSFALALSL